jgi:hypothetical protein
LFVVEKDKDMAAHRKMGRFICNIGYAFVTLSNSSYYEFSNSNFRRKDCQANAKDFKDTVLLILMQMKNGSINIVKFKTLFKTYFLFFTKS